MKQKILISPTTFGTCGRGPLELLEKSGYELVINSFKRKMTPEEVISLGKDCVGIVAGVESLNAQVLESLPNLRCISRVGVGMDSVDLKKADEIGIIVRNTPDGPTRAVAELTLGLIFDLLRTISLRDREIRKGKWNKDMGFLLQGKTVGILGLGRIGRSVAELLIKLDATVIGTDLYPDKKWLKKNDVALRTLDEVLKESDILCIHISYSSENKHLIGKPQIALMKKGAFLVNVSRGGVVDEQALYESLKTGHLKGAAIDTFEQEPYTGPLRELDSVVLTPHVGSYAYEARLKMEEDAVNNLLDVLKQPIRMKKTKL
jgi:D-3-phosphoglycerate dehydrogenase / 2-oxoglutarate reductase